MTTPRSTAPVPLARAAREHFVAQVVPALGPLTEAVRSRLIELVDSASSTREMHERRDAMMEFDRERTHWADAVRMAWRRAVVPPTATARVRLDSAALSLIGDDVVENKILSSRLAMAIQEKAVWELNDLLLRIQHLDGTEELASEDVLRPEALAQLAVEQWTTAGLPRLTWVMVKDIIEQHLVPAAVQAYQSTNQYLIDRNVLRDIDLSARVRRGQSAPGRASQHGSGFGASAPQELGAAPTTPGPLGPSGGSGGGGQGGSAGGAGGGYGGSGFAPTGPGGPGRFAGGPGGGAAGGGGRGGHDGHGSSAGGAAGAYGGGGFAATGPGGPGRFAGSADGGAGGGHGGAGSDFHGYPGAGGFGGGAGAGGGPGGGGGGPGGGGGGGGWGGSASGPGGAAHGGAGGAGPWGPGSAGAGAGAGAGTIGGADSGSAAAASAPGGLQQGFAGGAAGGAQGGNWGAAAGRPGAGGSGQGSGTGSDFSPAGDATTRAGAAAPMGGAAGFASTNTGRHGGPSGYAGGVADETRMLTSSTPLARARMRASGVLGQLKRLLSERVAGFDVSRPARPSAELEQALTHHAQQVVTQVQTQVQTQVHTRVNDSEQAEVIVFDNAAVEQVALDLRQRTGELKKKATTTTEKATIEIVALMFQSILSEERIPPGIRVWFARLQMPVLRVAIAEPEFFGSLEHPARQLIDRMGSCVLGFDASSISGSALEGEIKRVVQVIEQYPETGRRVFQLVVDEFQRFLAKFLTESGSTQKLVSVAQQVEQKETMAVQYTIELRKMLSDVPVRDEIREFLFKVWAEVLAVAAVRNGPQHEQTVALKKAAADLVWAASAKPNRNDRARVINDLPRLLQHLREGMALLGLPASVQEDHIKVIGDTLADAFLSKTEAIPQARLDEMARRLANLEDFVTDESMADVPLDKDSIEMMLGIDATHIEVIADGGSQPNAAMLSWAQELQQGNWFSLDHNGKISHVQYMWRSDRGQLHLLAAPDGRSFLFQLRRMAAYLQAGLLVPTEEEALTVRATREALAKLDANPERLLQ